MMTEWPACVPISDLVVRNDVQKLDDLKACNRITNNSTLEI